MAFTQFSNKWSYQTIWLVVFVYFAICLFAIFLFTGKMFYPESGKIHIVAILFAWIVEYIGTVLTSVLIILVGIGVALRTTLEKRK